MRLNDATPEEWDAVTKPSHYNNGGVECIDYIAQQTEDVKSYLEGNAIKYLHRYKYKQKEIQDLNKAIWYIQRLIKEIAHEGY
jgi:hypothetical protein